MTYDEAAALPILEVLPHALPMALLDRTVSFDSEAYLSELSIRPDSVFCDGEKVGAWIGVEYMAQSIAAYAGADAKRRGEAVKPGFFIACREYHCGVPYFKVGSTLRIRVKKVVHDPAGLSVVECSLSQKGESEALVTAMLTVYEVPDLEAHLKDKV